LFEKSEENGRRGPSTVFGESGNGVKFAFPRAPEYGTLAARSSIWQAGAVKLENSKWWRSADPVWQQEKNDQPTFRKGVRSNLSLARVPDWLYRCIARSSFSD
jgi:hypothetical protein